MLYAAQPIHKHKRKGARSLKTDKDKLKSLVKEFARYLVVGGAALLVDWGTLYLSYNYVFVNLGDWQLILATATGFILGLIFNYILSLIWVFQSAKASNKGKTVGAFLIFAVIGVIGLLLTEGGMKLGTLWLGEKYYMVVKIFVAGVVLIWNYVARKIFIFKDEPKACKEKQPSSLEQGPQA
jgi:putative flippase GtrA